MRRQDHEGAGARRISDEAVKAATGKTWKEWSAIQDAWDEAAKGHKATARYLAEQYKLSGWWSQTVVVRYEWERGRRANCTVRFAGREADGDVLLDADQLIINAQGELRLTIPKAKVTSASGKNGVLTIGFSRGEIELDLGPQAERWAKELQTQKR